MAASCGRTELFDEDFPPDGAAFADAPDVVPPSDGGMPEAEASVPHDASPPLDADAPEVLVPCGVASCTGCCGSDGLCHPGTAVAACGTGGNACSVCDPDFACTGGACAPAGTARIVLFGGSNLLPYSDDTWVWDGAAWTQQMVAGPSAREGHAMATRGTRAVLFGGFGNYAVPLADTWEWDGAAWTQRNVAGPSPRAYHAMAELNGKVVLFGGFLDSQEYSDTWEWDGESWTQRSVSGPPGRSGGAMATLGGRVILSGGYVDGAGTVLSDTWAWDGNAWTEITTQGPTEYEHAMAALGDSIVLSGWFHADTVDQVAYNETQTFDGMVWTKLGLEGPTIRQGPAMASTGSQAVLFGGFDNTVGEATDETWLWDGVRWNKAQVAGPPPRWMTAMARFYAQ